MNRHSGGGRRHGCRARWRLSAFSTERCPAAACCSKGSAPRVPVICVGNYSLGGAGKTPTVMALVKLLRRAGETPVVLSRGYGGSLAGPVRVDAAKHAAADVGDEPLLLARAAPVIVSRDRVAGADAARAAGASVIVMDDGFQNPSLRKDLSLIVIDGSRGARQRPGVSGGPACARRSRRRSAAPIVLLVSGEGAAADAVAAQVKGKGGLVLKARIVADPDAVAALRGSRVLAFAGIGDPQRFFATLRASGIDVAATRSFADHHPFTADEVAQLIEEARKASLHAGDDGEGFGPAARSRRRHCVDRAVPHHARLRRRSSV